MQSRGATGCHTAAGAVDVAGVWADIPALRMSCVVLPSLTPPDLTHVPPLPYLVPPAEARGGLHVVEQSLWAAVPDFLRRLSTALKKHTGRELPLRATPIKFGSWMGGDRDGNPNVTSKTTHHVVALSRCAGDMRRRSILHGGAVVGLS